MLELYKTYGETIHTWDFDQYLDLPLRSPHLLMSYSSDEQAPPREISEARDERLGMDTKSKRRLRDRYLRPCEKHSGADVWEKTGKVMASEAVERDVEV